MLLLLTAKSLHVRFWSPLLDGVSNGPYVREDFTGQALVSVTQMRGRDDQPQTSRVSSPDHLCGVINVSQQQRKKKKKQSIFLTDRIIFISCSTPRSPSAQEAAKTKTHSKTTVAICDQQNFCSCAPSKVSVWTLLPPAHGSSGVPGHPLGAQDPLPAPSVLAEGSSLFPQLFSSRHLT